MTFTTSPDASASGENPALLRRSHFGRGIGLAAAAALALTACGGDDGDGDESADAEDVGDQDTEFLTVATGGSSGVYYQIGATLADLLASELDSDASAQATGASAENINMLTDGDAELGFTMGDTNVQALEGTGPFEDDPREDLMAIAALYQNTVQLVATEESGIESVEDLEGSRVAVGDVGSGTEMNANVVLEGHGLSYDDMTADYLSFEEAVDQMANGHVDAAFVTSGLPNPGLTELATSTDFIIVPIEGEARDDLIEEREYLEESQVPGGTYQQEEDVETLGVTNHLLVSSELSEDAAYDITEVFFENLESIHNSHAAAEEIELENAAEGLTVPLHPGAERYLEENDVDVSGDE
ncbi:TAXI family TRAP transporter solute-binding subunit [Nesterenkonia marinintestina]|uniref:TAXI family TRAP transporter solute-binding subunit n=1 Tax=Nesterenkonia marinintestina TaxID=2979865 RepID=UPI0021C16FA8|nr:TAXI family TRAP transporter solute-binding subunit [Nesterenkonia sp. GX14115]